MNIFRRVGTGREGRETRGKGRGLFENRITIIVTAIEGEVADRTEGKEWCAKGKGRREG